MSADGDRHARRLAALESLLAVSLGDVELTLVHTSDVVAKLFGAEKIDAFLYDAARDTLVAKGTSNQPLAAVQRRLGLDTLALSNGGRCVQVFREGRTFLSGRLDEDREELPGVRDALGVRSCIVVPLTVGEKRRGVLAITSRAPDAWTEDDARFAESVGRWVGHVLQQAELVAQLEVSAVGRGRRMAAEELVTVLAHDLRNCLNPATLAMHLVRQRAERDHRTDDIEDTARARRALARLDALVTDLLDVARIDGGVFATETQPVELVALVEEIAAVLTTAEHPVNVVAPERVPATVDPARIRQCLENLVSNAVRHSPKHAPVDVVVRRTGPDEAPAVRIEVVDRGPGIDADVLPFLFERFVSGRGGLGLGLYLARKIAELHRGELTVESCPGKGARFILTLPPAAPEGGTDLDSRKA
jgi:two-component system, OmpR family, sensor kinase